MSQRQVTWQPGFSLSRKPTKRPRRSRKQHHQFKIVIEQPHGSSHGPAASSPSSGPATGNSSSLASQVTNSRGAAETTISSAVEYGSLTERFRPILTRYNTEFCAIPLTFELRINPFRYRTDVDPEPIFLVHAVMALAGHHLDSKTTMDHRHTALQLLRQSLDGFSDAETMYSILDTIIILFSLDETQSMLGNWGVHLTGAYQLIEACGGIQSISVSSRVETQIGILTWWDAIASLLSREECVFPYEYFAAVLSNQSKREWDFFGLCGCPTAIVEMVMKLAHLRRRRNDSDLDDDEEEEEEENDTDFTTTMTMISEIEDSLTSWRHVPDPATAYRDEESMARDLDTMHCSEAWRHGLLLYIHRVFRRRRKPGPGPGPGSESALGLGSSSGVVVPQSHLTYRARVIVDHITSCRDYDDDGGDMVSRQALFPLFLAGCELADRKTRARIVKLIKRWDERTRYHMFSGAIPLLEEVWAAREDGDGFGDGNGVIDNDRNSRRNDDDDVWWGQIVDRRHVSQGHPLKMRLCFG